MIKKIFTTSFFLTITIWLAAQTNVLKLDQLTTKDGLPHNSIQSITQDKYGLIWLSSFSGLYKFDGYEFTNYRPDPSNESALISGGVYNLITDSLKQLYVAFFDTAYVCKYNYEKDNFQRIKRHRLSPEVFSKIPRKRKESIKVYHTESYTWTLSNNLLTKIDIEKGDSTHFYIETPMGEPIANDDIATMFIDKHENLWLGTENMGIFKVNTNSKPFYSYFSYSKNKPVIIKDIIRAIDEDKQGNIWIGTFYDGIKIYDRKNVRLTELKRNPDQPKNTLISNEIRSILNDSKGNVWIGTKQGLSKYNKETRRFTNFSYAGENFIPNNWVHTIIEDHEGVIWIGTFNGIAKYNPDSNTFTTYDPRVNLMNRQVDIIIEDRYYNLWVGTQGGGVTCLKRKAHSTQFNPVHYINSREDTNSLSSNRVFSITEDDEGYIWISTEFGLNRLDPISGDFLRFNQEHGLPDEMLMGVLTDDNHNLWISHKKGISRLNTNTFEVRNFSEQDGLQGDEFSENACYKSHRTGELYFGGSQGLNSFLPHQIEENTILPKVIFTGLEILNQDVTPQKEVNGRVVLTKPIMFTEKLYLKYTDKSFSIKFAALHYVNPKDNSFKYKLEGYDDNWINADPVARFATYSNLPAGKYRFKVKAANNDGIWNPTPIELSINISPPWWNNIIAYVAYILIAMLIFYLINDYMISREKFKNEMRYERMKMDKMLELEEMKIQFFTNVSHEFRTPLSLIIDPLRKLNNAQVNPEQAKYYYSVMYQNAQTLLRLVNQLLDIRKLEKGHLKLDFRQSDVVAYARAVFETFSIKAKQRNIKYKFFSAASGITARFDPDKLEKIITNLLSNAFKYTNDDGEISLEIYQKKENTDNLQDNGNIVIAVHDNGMGISSRAQKRIFDRFYQERPTRLLQHTRGTGIGLAYTKQLVELLKGKITVKSSPGVGSVFTVVLPIGDINSYSNTEIQLPENNDVENHVPKEAPEQAESILPTINKEKLTLLLVEDNQDVRTYIKNEIKSRYNILEASNGAEGISIAIEFGPDIIVSDVMMPDVDGLQLCKRIKSDEKTSHIPVILLTARQSDEYRREGYELGADAYITKPFNTTVLLAIVKSLVDNRQKLKELFSTSPFVDIKQIAGNSADEKFLEQAIKTIEEEISNPDFNIDALSDMLHISRRHLTHKVKTLTDQTVLEFIKTVRLNKGAKLLLEKNLSISEISYSLGYNVPANFSRSFSKQFGKTPSEYIDSFTA